MERGAQYDKISVKSNIYGLLPSTSGNGPEFGRPDSHRWKHNKEIAPGDHLSQIIKVQIAIATTNGLSGRSLRWGQTLEAPYVQLSPDKDTSTFTARPLLNVSPESFHLDPGKSTEVNVEGDIPNDASPGGRYAIIKIATLPAGNGTVKLSVGALNLVNLTVSGSGVASKTAIENLSLEEPILARQQNLSLVFTNIGNIAYKPKVTAMIKDKEGNVVANSSLPAQYILLPTFSRLNTLRITPGNTLSPGTYNVNATVSLNDGTILASKETSFEVKS